jgi:hypothetical protein
MMKIQRDDDHWREYWKDLSDSTGCENQYEKDKKRRYAY